MRAIAQPRDVLPCGPSATAEVGCPAPCGAVGNGERADVEAEDLALPVGVHAHACQGVHQGAAALAESLGERVAHTNVYEPTSSGGP